ncbi:MAG: hypothetical protein EBY15_13190 [Gammaproteobacteria bacterium]|nr:hypothetical protein [Gammaproteobacteria bacterium]
MLIVGGGPSGCAAAMSLLREGFDVALMTRRPAHRLWAGESLPPGTGELINSIFGEAILDAPHHVKAYGTRSCWGSDDWVETDFLANPLGHGWILDRSVFDHDLRQEVLAAGGRLIQDQSIRSLRRHLLSWDVTTTSRAKIRCRWIVDATGRSGSVLRRLGIKRTALDRQTAFIGVLEGQNGTYQGTSIEAVSEGWWYSTPLPHGKTVVALITDRGLVKASGPKEALWRSKLEATIHIKPSLQSYQKDLIAGWYPAETSYRSHLFGLGWAAAGDAAIAFDPLSSQGISTAILMGARLGKALADGLHEQDHASLDAWQRDYYLLLHEHEALRAYYWHAESRWPEYPFWKSRRPL